MPDEVAAVAFVAAGEEVGSGSPAVAGEPTRGRSTVPISDEDDRHVTVYILASSSTPSESAPAWLGLRRRQPVHHPVERS